MRVKTKEINITSLDVISLNVRAPTFQTARIRTVYNRFGFKVAKYLICKIFDDEMNYKNEYFKLR